MHHIKYLYVKITKTNLKDNWKRFNEALYTTVLINKHFERVDDCIQYYNDGKNTYLAAQIIKNYYNMVLSTVIYNETRKMWRKKSVAKKHGQTSKFYFQKSTMTSKNYKK